MKNDKSQFSISVTAAEKVKQQLQNRGTPNAHLRLGVKGSGCSGFSYVIQFEDSEPKENDHTFQIEGISLIIDKKSMVYLNGSILDWEQTLLQRGFKFINPNEKSRCGCGESFSI